MQITLISHNISDHPSCLSAYVSDVNFQVQLNSVSVYFNINCFIYILFEKYVKNAKTEKSKKWKEANLVTFPCCSHYPPPLTPPPHILPTSTNLNTNLNMCYPLNVPPCTCSLIRTVQAMGTRNNITKRTGSPFDSLLGLNTRPTTPQLKKWKVSENHWIDVGLNS